jgi:hypothetical protein
MVFGIQEKGHSRKPLTASQIRVKAVSFNIIRSTEWWGQQ